MAGSGVGELQTRGCCAAIGSSALVLNLKLLGAAARKKQVTAALPLLLAGEGAAGSTSNGIGAAKGDSEAISISFGGGGTESLTKGWRCATRFTANGGVRRGARRFPPW